VTHYLLPATLVALQGVDLQPIGDLSLNRLREHVLRALSEHLAENIFTAGQWQGAGRACRKLHGGVLLGLVGQLGKNFALFLPKYAAFLFRLSTRFGNSSIAGVPKSRKSRRSSCADTLYQQV